MDGHAFGFARKMMETSPRRYLRRGPERIEKVAKATFSLFIKVNYTIKCNNLGK